MRLKVLDGRSDFLARADMLRKRGLRVLEVGPWLVLYVPRNHWSEHL
jgi:hypothetical protein